MQLRESESAAQGYRMPPEWARHAATWLSWPHNPETWGPGQLEAVESVFCDIVAALAPAETVRINVLDGVHARQVERLLEKRVPMERVLLHELPTNDAWIRDHGAIFVVDEAADAPVIALDFAYNAWGDKYPPYDLDQQAAQRMGRLLPVPVRSEAMVLEGGSIDVDGRGLLLTTEQCLLNPNRNPSMTQSEIEQTIRAAFGVEQILWLGDGIEGDDTDGHVDDLTRFVAPATVVTVIEGNGADPNHVPLAENRRRLDELELAGSRKLDVIELPMPAPLFNQEQRLPASYANFYIGNEVVLVPQFDCDEDQRALGILGDCFPERRPVPIDCRVLVAGLGAIHCLTQQVPAIVDDAPIT